MNQTTSTLIPAQPGWGIVIPLAEEDGQVLDVAHEPIIAWLLNSSNGYAPTPITIAGPEYQADFILLPDGSYEAPGLASYPDKAALLQEMKNQEQQRERKRK